MHPMLATSQCNIGPNAFRIQLSSRALSCLEQATISPTRAEISAAHHTFRQYVVHALDSIASFEHQDTINNPIWNTR